MTYRGDGLTVFEEFTSAGDPVRLRREKWCLIAAKIESDPGLLRVPLENIARWLENGHSGRRHLDWWREKVEAAQRDTTGFGELLDWLRREDEKAAEMKSYSPFPGVLTSEEVDLFRCAFQH